MELKPGYKQTEVGAVPEEWNVVAFSDLFDFRNGVNASKESYGRGIPFVNVLEIITKGHLKVSDVPGKVSLTKGAIDLYTVRCGDLLFNRTSETQEEVGLAAAYLDDEPAVFGGFVIRGRPRNANLDATFSGYAFRSPSIRAQIIARGQGAIRANVGQGDLRTVLAALPPLPEQCGIAEALSDADALIESLEHLLTKKRQIKQGAMQESLRGKKRLPGFSGGWEVKRLGDTAILKARIGWQGLTTVEYRDSGDYYLVTGTEFRDGRVDWNTCHYVNESRYKQDKHIQLKERDVLVTKDGTIGKVALVTNLFRPATLNSGVFVIRPIEGAFDPEFLYHLLSSSVFTEFLVQLSAGSTINHLYQKDFVGFVYRTPPTIEEQTAIAAILSDMDAEIDVLKAKLTKARQLKRGMMQELLSGRIRLV